MKKISLMLVSAIGTAALAHDGRMTWQAVGRQVHLTGQAVATRVQQMVDDGTIRGFTVLRGDLRRYFITVFMDTPQFDAFEAFLQAHADVESASKIAGEGCYHVTDIPRFANAAFDALSCVIHPVMTGLEKADIMATRCKDVVALIDAAMRLPLVK